MLYGGKATSADLGTCATSLKNSDPLDWRRPGSVDVRVTCG